METGKLPEPVKPPAEPYTGAPELEVVLINGELKGGSEADAKKAIEATGAAYTEEITEELTAIVQGEKPFFKSEAFDHLAVEVIDEEFWLTFKPQEDDLDEIDEELGIKKSRYLDLGNIIKSHLKKEGPGVLMSNLNNDSVSFATVAGIQSELDGEVESYDEYGDPIEDPEPLTEAEIKDLQETIKRINETDFTKEGLVLFITRDLKQVFRTVPFN